MAEYWKSTPKYWCKHCTTYVKDTKIERNLHEATGRHQGNLKRFLRDIQNNHEKDEREKQRAKSEVERLNRAVGATSTSSAQTSAHISRRTTAVSASSSTVADRKRQMAQLAEMGIAVPDEFRGEMALAGDWQVVSQKPVESGQETEKGSSLSVGVRKRKFEGQEEDEGASETIQRKGWGSTTKQYPSHAHRDLDVLLAGNISAKKEESLPTLKQEDSDQLTVEEHVCYNAQEDQDAIDATENPQVKQEAVSAPSATSDQVAEETRAPSLGSLEVVFKKRKSKATRPK
ncbi:hypothetical protein EPUS_04114 [Endocarpon pusillum Z07020]|uniref:U1-C C2H2-type zinc finger domain-containing protein n=1 Tax=Endocarpon pusillum (strain Z07020 / HMAS-L-300199) TaxID=1263415 RepID=U1GNI0_ENDPU|nr:uncharacterized protein EPUS_04114 [Endocarpon pusillum Z07020]ERF73491.1 hypothetical protein EPUS_04114 [Endocarpon pusillum Z07020]